MNMQNFDSLDGNLSFKVKLSRNFNSDHACSVACVHTNFGDFASWSKGKITGFKNGKYLFYYGNIDNLDESSPFDVGLAQARIAFIVASSIKE